MGSLFYFFLFRWLINRLEQIDVDAELRYVHILLEVDIRSGNIVRTCVVWLYASHIHLITNLHLKTEAITHYEADTTTRTGQHTYGLGISMQEELRTNLRIVIKSVGMGNLRLSVVVFEYSGYGDRYLNLFIVALAAHLVAIVEQYARLKTCGEVFTQLVSRTQICTTSHKVYIAIIFCRVAWYVEFDAVLHAQREVYRTAEIDLYGAVLLHKGVLLNLLLLLELRNKIALLRLGR